MGELKGIISHRYFVKDYFMDIVREWEDEISKQLQLKTRCDISDIKRFGGFVNIYAPWLWKLIQPRKYCLEYVIEPTWHSLFCRGRHHVLVSIIDFWSREQEKLDEFSAMYENNPIVLVSSREAYEYLTTMTEMSNLHHWPLSLPDKYAIDHSAVFDKKYDCVLVGRPNKVFTAWMKRYVESHPDFTYVYNTRQMGGENCYVSSNGDVLGDALATRSGYFKLLRSAKIGLYSTPGQDCGNVLANGFNPVTPRFLEYIASGCHVLARYPRNADTDWYELPRMAPHIESYDEFVNAINVARETPVDIGKYVAYCKQHYTSVRVKSLLDIMKDLP